MGTGRPGQIQGAYLTFGPDRKGELCLLAIVASIDYRIGARDGCPSSSSAGPVTTTALRYQVAAGRRETLGAWSVSFSFTTGTKRSSWRNRSSRPERWNKARPNVPPKIRELIADLLAAGFVDRGGKGSHRNFVHPKVSKPVTISGAMGDDAKQYQVRAVQLAIEESRR